jgi:hypothetical protein
MLILDGKALKALIYAAVALNTSSAAHELILVPAPTHQHLRPLPEKSSILLGLI